MVTKIYSGTREATHDDRKNLANLIHFETFVHRHLDYKPALDWVGHHPFPVMEQRGKLVAALACPADPPNVAWIRVFASVHNLPPTEAWEALWPNAYAQLKKDAKITCAAAVPINAWFTTLLKNSGFEETHRVVMMSWHRSNQAPKPVKPPINIRPMTLDDLDDVREIDHASFVPVWQNSLDYLEIAFRQAVFATVVEYEDKLVGYQISTATHMGGHLARLAVDPRFQRRGFGYALLQDVIRQFRKRGAQTITVNTQKENIASLSLYKKAGFQQTGEEYPIFELPLQHKGGG
jgi:ribosomal protein S18 acetylase RimI-like enzyme